MIINLGNAKLDINFEELDSFRRVQKPDLDSFCRNNPQYPPIVVSRKREDYILIPDVKGLFGDPVFVSKFEVSGTNGKNYEDTHRLVFQSQNGLYIPPPRIFMPHFKNVVGTYNNNGVLLDANANPISGEEHEEIYRHLTTNFKDIYGHNRPGAWTWLNARFVPGSGFNELDLETVVGIEQNGSLRTKKEPLMPYLKKDCYAELEFNAQGLPTSEAAYQEYRQGKNLRSFYPREGSVARFDADSDGAGFDCGRGPQGSNSALGVFLCTEGGHFEN